MSNKSIKNEEYQWSWQRSIEDRPRRERESLSAESTLPRPNLHGSAANLVAIDTSHDPFSCCLSLINLQLILKLIDLLLDYASQSLAHCSHNSGHQLSTLLSSLKYSLSQLYEIIVNNPQLAFTPRIDAITVNLIWLIIIVNLKKNAVHNLVPPKKSFRINSAKYLQNQRGKKLY